MRKILVILLSAVMILTLCSCGGASPTNTAENFLNAVKAGDAEAIAEVYVDSDFDILNAASDSDEEDAASETSDSLTMVYEEQLLPKLQDFDFEISNEQIDGDSATVEVKFTTYKIGEAFSEFFGEYLTQAFALVFSDPSDEQMDEIAGSIMSEKVGALTEKSFEKTATMKLVKKDNQWLVEKISDDSDLLDAMSGGLVTMVQSLDESFSE